MTIIICTVYFLKDVSLTIAFLCVLQTLLPVTLRKSIPLAATYAAITALTNTVGILNSENYLNQQYELLDLFSFCVISISAFVFIKKPPVKKSIFTAIICVSTIDMLWSFVQSFAGIDLNSDFAVIAECSFNILCAVVLIVAYAVLSKKHLVCAVSYAANKFPVWIILALFIFELACYYNEFGANEIIYRVSFNLSACMMVAGVIYLFFSVQRLLNKQTEILDRLSEQISFSEDVRKSDTELRAFRHDIKNHVIVLKSLFLKGEYERASDYFNGICCDIEPLINRFSTGNSVADSLLTVKSESCKIEFDGTIPENFLPPEDLCIILGNLLDNAIKAVAESENDNNIVTVQAWVRNGNLIIKISNPTKEYYEKKKVFRKLQTTKKDKHNHGYGLANVRKSVTDNNGSLELSSEKGIFTAKVIIKGE